MATAGYSFYSMTAIHEHNNKLFLENLRKWAMEHGSPYLRDLIAGDYRWHDLARDEFEQLHRPEGFVRLSALYYYDERTRLHAPLEELEILDEWNQRLIADPTLPFRNSRLAWIVAHRSMRSDRVAFAALITHLVTPDGIERPYYRQLLDDNISQREVE